MEICKRFSVSVNWTMSLSVILLSLFVNGRHLKGWQRAAHNARIRLFKTNRKPLSWVDNVKVKHSTNDTHSSVHLKSSVLLNFLGIFSTPPLLMNIVELRKKMCLDFKEHLDIMSTNLLLIIVMSARCVDWNGSSN